MTTAQARYEQTPKGKATKRRYVESRKGRRTQLIYNRTGRYALAVDRFIQKVEAKHGSVPNGTD